jgi:tRNA A-37 threonylcarbamoyl transferase component Bud32
MDTLKNATPEPPDPLLGEVLHGRYRVIKALGRGGMGVVYLGEHVLIRRKVAIKMLLPQFTASAELIERFQREARAAAAIGNAHIADVTDMGRLDNGSYYIVLEYLEGIDLASLVAAEGALPVARAIEITLQVCGALSAVHAAQIIHRDLKPENIMLLRREDGADFVKILDFGVCKFRFDQTLTATGIAVGTPRFMPPEQLEARPDLDQRADIYAAGATLFFALTGRGPFDSVSPTRLFMSIWTERAPRAQSLRAEIPAALDAAIARALEKDPRARFASAADFARALRQCAEPATKVEASLDAPAAVAPTSNTEAPPSAATGPDALNEVGLESDAWLSARARGRKLRRRAAAVAAGVCAVIASWLVARGLEERGPGRVHELSPAKPARVEAVDANPAPHVPGQKAAAQLAVLTPALTEQKPSESQTKGAKRKRSTRERPQDLSVPQESGPRDASAARQDSAHAAAVTGVEVPQPSAAGGPERESDGGYLPPQRELKHVF